MSTERTSWVEVSKRALSANVRQIKKRIGPASLYAVVKSNAYGHGVHEVVSILNKEAAVAGYMVAHVDEALTLLSRTRKQIVVMNIWERDDAKIRKAARAHIVLPVYDIAQARWLHDLGKRMRKKIRVHVKIDVGTMRLGFRHDEAAAAIRKLWKMDGLMVNGIFSHFADSENLDESFTIEQARRFDGVISQLAQKGITIPMQHIACTAASLRNRKYAYSAVRVGIGLYGLWPSRDIEKSVGAHLKLVPALSWKTKIIQLKTVQAGEPVGYGLSFRSPRATRIGVIPIGYWDGYDRKFSNSAEVLLNGIRCPVRGRVCMNVTMIEVPLSISAKTGDEVVLIGAQRKEKIAAEELARMAGTINYEIVTRINPLLPRIII